MSERKEREQRRRDAWRDKELLMLDRLIEQDREIAALKARIEELEQCAVRPGRLS